MIYEICYKNQVAFTIDDGGKVEIMNSNLIPMDIYVEQSDDIDDRANNLVNFFTWAAERIVHMDRKYAKELLAFYGFDNASSLRERAKIGIATRCLSINDGFWVRKENESIKWEDVNLYQNSLNGSVFELPLVGKGFTVSKETVTPDFYTDGTAAKAWRRERNDFYLLKADNGNDSVRKEYEASCILGRIFGNIITSYNLEQFQDKEVSVCKCFTTEDIHLVKADYYSIYRMNHGENFGIDLQTRWKNWLETMVLADYLVGNTDRHARNWGIMYSCYDDKFHVLGLSPIYDFDHAFEGKGNEVCQPYLFLGKQMRLEDAAKEIITAKPHIAEFLVKIIPTLKEYKYGDYVKDRIAIIVPMRKQA
ncbi:hypothetical protein SAMN02910301_2237 [Lachnospiraceae bacterium XBD2001]|nr:hypothetical protein SAMN02910301_2237 [Lachnospiraceae bacterium XBD2001]